MGTVRIKAGIIAMGSDYYGATTVLSTKVFDMEKMDNVFFGYCVPPSDAGLGSASSPLSFIEGTTVVSTAIRGIYFDYNHSDNIRKRYFISATSDAYISAAQSTDYNEYVALSPISPYTAII